MNFLKMQKKLQLKYTLSNFIRYSSSFEGSIVRKTRLHEFHVSKGGKMVDFAGWNMPIQYDGHSISQSHIYTREKGSLFDVSHMLQVKILGKDNKEFLESLVVGDIKNLGQNKSLYTLFTNDKGGIIDDFVVSNTSEGYLYFVSNAGCFQKDFEHLSEKCNNFTSEGKDVKIDRMDDFSLLAVQGPAVASTLQAHSDLDLSKMIFMTTCVGRLFDVEGIRFTRCGYTGEDGFELSIPNDSIVYLTERLLEVDNEIIKLAGLGARDTLRLEAGLCLYGQDINDSTTPVEASLNWTIGKHRRETGGFPGADVILKQLKEKPNKKRIGLISTGPPVRAHGAIFSGKTCVGNVTSGGPSPCLKKNIAIGYVNRDVLDKEENLSVEVRRKKYDAQIVKLPFLKHKYYQ